MKKIYFLMVFFAICFCVLMSNVSNNGVNADAKCEVSFHFDGLQAIAFGDSKRVSDGILDVHHHTPKLEIKEIEKGKEKIIFNVEGQDLYRKVLNISMPNNAHKPIRYYSPDMTKDSTDFRWCLDLETDIFQKQLYLKDDFFCKIHFNTATFYTTKVTQEKYQFTAGSKIHSFKREIGEPAARVDLQPNDNLIITGLGKEITLPYEKGISYKISITNLPPKEMASVDHFGFYYDIFKEPVTRYIPVMIKKAAYLPHPPPIMCNAIILGKSTIN